MVWNHRSQENSSSVKQILKLYLRALCFRFEDFSPKLWVLSILNALPETGDSANLWFSHIWGPGWIMFLGTGQQQLALHLSLNGSHVINR